MNHSPEPWSAANNELVDADGVPILKVRRYPEGRPSVNVVHAVMEVWGPPYRCLRELLPGVANGVHGEAQDDRDVRELLRTPDPS